MVVVVVSGRQAVARAMELGWGEAGSPADLANRTRLNSTWQMYCM